MNISRPEILLRSVFCFWLKRQNHFEFGWYSKFSYNLKTLKQKENNPLCLHCDYQALFLSRSEANLALHQSSEDSLRIVCQYICARPHGW